jgi:phage FluMu gp28-like protein
MDGAISYQSQAPNPEPHRQDRPQFVIGVDLGQLRDCTAIAVIECSDDAYHVRHLERLALGSPYTKQVARVATLIRQVRAEGEVRVIIDATGVGRPIVDLLRPEIGTLTAATLTGGDAVTREGQEVHVPKRDVVSMLKARFGLGQLLIARQLPLAEALVQELLAVEVRLSPSGHDSYGAWREGDHDDLVLALGLAIWNSENRPTRVRIIA